MGRSDGVGLSEAEKRLHRCCFSGHRPEKLDVPEDVVREWLVSRIDEAIAAGYRTFICGMAMGVDIMAGQIVRAKKEKDPSLHLICVVPWPGFAAKWKMVWEVQYEYLLKHADFVKYISKTYSDDVLQKRNEWMVDHSHRLIAYYNGSSGGTWNTIEYAVRQGIEVVTNRPELVEEFKAGLVTG